jgi:hypothetical protein
MKFMYYERMNYTKICFSNLILVCIGLLQPPLEAQSQTFPYFSNTSRVKKLHMTQNIDMKIYNVYSLFFYVVNIS